MSRWFAAGLLLLVILFAAVYFFSAQIIARVALELVGARGFLLHEISVHRPDIDGIHIDRLVGDVGNVHIVADDIDVSYSFEALLARSVDAIKIRDLQIRVNEPSAAPLPTEPEAGAKSEFDPAIIFGIVPQLNVDSLLLEIVQSSFVGNGSLKLYGDTAVFELAGIQPDFARNLSVAGLVQSNTKLEFFFFDASEPNTPFLQLYATSEGGDIDVTSHFDLSGPPLHLVTGLLSLPDGTGRVKGELASNLNSFDVTETYQTLSLTGSYQIDWQSEDFAISSLRGLLSGSLANIALTLAGGNIDLPQSAVRFTVGSGTTVQYADNKISIGPGMTATLQNLEAVEFQSTLTQSVIDLQGADVKISTGANFAVTGYGLQTEGSVTGDIALQTNTVVADLSINIDDMDFPLHLDYDSVSGRTDIDSESRLTARNLGHSLVQNWPYEFDIVSGEVDMKLQAVLLDGALNATAAVALTNGTVHYDDFEFLNTTAALDFMLDSSGLQLQPSTINVGEFDFGLPLQDAELRVAWQDGVVDLVSGQFDLLGGSVTVAPTQYDLNRNQANLDLTVANIDLSQVMALEGDDITGEGRLYGTLPVRVNDGKVSMSKGQIHASEAGGMIQISPKFNLGTGQPGVDFALRALADFNYQTLTAVADYEENGDLQLAVGLQGRNPEIEKGRPIHYNLNINENIFSLIDALTAESGVTERVERGVMKNQ